MTSPYPHESMVLSSRALVTRFFSTSVSTACRAKHMYKLTSSNQHHSLKPVFSASLPLDCRHSSPASLLLKAWNTSQTLQLEGGIQGTGMLNPRWPWAPLCIPYLCLWAAGLRQHGWVSRNQQSSAQTLPACCQNNVPVLWCPSRSIPDA